MVGGTNLGPTWTNRPTTGGCDGSPGAKEGPHAGHWPLWSLHSLVASNGRMQAFLRARLLLDIGRWMEGADPPFGRPRWWVVAMGAQSVVCSNTLPCGRAVSQILPLGKQVEVYLVLFRLLVLEGFIRSKTNAKPAIIQHTPISDLSSMKVQNTL